MHSLGFIYRDLKPSNVLLLPNGHIKLVDMGGVVEPMERMVKEKSNFSLGALSFLSEYADFSSTRKQRKMSNTSVEVESMNSSGGRSSRSVCSESSNQISNRLVRSCSIVGTPGYVLIVLY